MKTWRKKVCIHAGLLACAVFSCLSPSLAAGGTLGVFSEETLAHTPLGITLTEAEQLYGKKHIPTSWASKGRIWNFPEYSLILFFEGPGNVSTRLTICRKKSLTLAEAAQFAATYLPKGYSVVRSKLSNESQPVVFKSSNPLNHHSTGAWTNRPDWYCLDFHNARPREEIDAKALLGAIQKGDSEKGAVKRTEKQMAELRARPRLGMTLEELKALWGEGRLRDLKQYPCTLEGRNSRNDRDYLVFTSIAPQCTAWQWMFREQQNLSITAIMWRGRCVGLDLRRNGGFTVPEAIELAGEIVPGIAFHLPSVTKDGICTLYSRNLEQGYKLQTWGNKDYFELKSSLLIKKMKARRPVEQRASARALAAAMKEFSDKTQKPLVGLTLDEVKEVLGSGQELAERRWNERTWLWSDPNQDMILLGSFRDGGKHMLLHHLMVMDREHELDIQAALAIGYAATLPYAWPALSPAQLKSGFSIKSRDGQQRFLLKWYRDARTGPTLHLVDDLVDRVARKKEAEKPKKALETIKNIL